MPTNPLWLEHTEKAAWDTVQTLRAEVERANKRVQQLTELQGQWPGVERYLQSECEKRELPSAPPLSMLEALCERLQRLERQEAKDEAPVASSTEHQAESSAKPTGDERLSASVRWFARLVDRRRRTSGRTTVDPTRRAALLNALEHQVEDLAHARPRDLVDSAVEVARLALELARIGRRARNE
ncbi:MAG: hypothetical protein R3B13_10815 [Polyangiaceae bacterium]